MAELNPQPLPPRSRAVRITIPAAVAYNLHSFQNTIAHLAERLGCRGCFSGADCTFLHERDFMINEKLEVLSRSTSPVQGPWPDPWHAAPAKVSLHPKVANNLEQIKTAVAQIAGRLGCGQCCSGFDIQFQHEMEFIVNEAGQLRG